MSTTPQQDLALIRQLMEESRREVGERGGHFLIWGGITAVGLTVTYLAALGQLPWNPAWVWVGLLVVGWGASIVVGHRQGRQAGVSPLGRRLLSGTWIAVAVTMTLIGVAGMFGDVVPHVALPGLLSAVIAAPVLATALLTRQRWLGWVAGGWWLGGATMLFIPGIYSLPLMAVMSLLLLALPGAVLHARSRRVSGGEPALDASG